MRTRLLRQSSLLLRQSIPGEEMGAMTPYAQELEWRTGEVKAICQRLPTITGVASEKRRRGRDKQLAQQSLGHELGDKRGAPLGEQETKAFFVQLANQVNEPNPVGI